VRGLKVHYGSATDYSTYPEGPFDVVYDNNGKDMDSCKMLIDAAKVRSGWGDGFGFGLAWCARLDETWRFVCSTLLLKLSCWFVSQCLA
jgi:hypothetical protein